MLATSYGDGVIVLCDVEDATVLHEFNIEGEVTSLLWTNAEGLKILN